VSKAEILRKLKQAIREDVMVWAYRKRKGKRVMENVTICTVEELRKVLAKC
jgi:hypothetical protein